MEIYSRLFVIADELSKLGDVYDSLEQYMPYADGHWIVNTVEGTEANTKWFFFSTDNDLCENPPGYDESIDWDEFIQSCSDILGESGALIVQFTNSVSDTDSRHISTTPSGRMLDYDTSDEFGVSKSQSGYGKLKRAFIRAYARYGKNIFDIYDNLPNSQGKHTGKSIRDCKGNQAKETHNSGKEKKKQDNHPFAEFKDITYLNLSTNYIRTDDTGRVISAVADWADENEYPLTIDRDGDVHWLFEALGLSGILEDVNDYSIRIFCSFFDCTGLSYPILELLNILVPYFMDDGSLGDAITQEGFSLLLAKTDGSLMVVE